MPIMRRDIPSSWARLWCSKRRILLLPLRSILSISELRLRVSPSTKSHCLKSRNSNLNFMSKKESTQCKLRASTMRNKCKRSRNLKKLNTLTPSWHRFKPWRRTTKKLFLGSSLSSLRKSQLIFLELKNTNAKSNHHPQSKWSTPVRSREWIKNSHRLRRCMLSKFRPCKTNMLRWKQALPRKSKFTLPRMQILKRCTASKWEKWALNKKKWPLNSRSR